MRTFERVIAYNNIDVTKDVANMVASLSFEESISGEADSIAIEFSDQDGLWLDSWFPQDGDYISAQIYLTEWKSKDDNRSFELGKFFIDAPSFSGPPIKCALKGVSRKTNDGFAKTKRVKTWEKASVQTICQSICSTYGLEIYFDADDFTLDHVEQDDSDMSFLSSILTKYGYIMKIYQDKLIILDPDRFEREKPIFTIENGNSTVSNWSFENDWNESNYNACEINYTSPSGEDLSYKYVLDGVETDNLNVLILDETVANIQEAERLTRINLKNALNQRVKGSMTLMGEPGLISSAVINLKGFGKFDGLYCIQKSSHELTSKYETSIDFYKINILDKKNESVLIQSSVVINTKTQSIGGDNNESSTDRNDSGDKLSKWFRDGIILE